LIAWFGDPDTKPLAIASDATKLVCIDPKKNEVEIQAGGNTALHFQRHPRYLLLAGGTRLEPR
jgi:hypothetical protein